MRAYCPICGATLIHKKSFNVAKCPIDARKTLICPCCSYTTIKETKQEKEVRTGKAKRP